MAEEVGINLHQNTASAVLRFFAEVEGTFASQPALVVRIMKLLETNQRSMKLATLRELVGLMDGNEHLIESLDELCDDSICFMSGSKTGLRIFLERQDADGMTELWRSTDKGHASSGSPVKVQMSNTTGNARCLRLKSESEQLVHSEAPLSDMARSQQQGGCGGENECKSDTDKDQTSPAADLAQVAGEETATTRNWRLDPRTWYQRAMVKADPDTEVPANEDPAQNNLLSTSEIHDEIERQASASSGATEAMRTQPEENEPIQHSGTMTLEADDDIVQSSACAERIVKALDDGIREEGEVREDASNQQVNTSASPESTFGMQAVRDPALGVLGDQTHIIEETFEHDDHVSSVSGAHDERERPASAGGGAPENVITNPANDENIQNSATMTLGGSDDVVQSRASAGRTTKASDDAVGEEGEVREILSNQQLNTVASPASTFGMQAIRDSVLGVLGGKSQIMIEEISENDNHVSYASEVHIKNEGHTRVGSGDIEGVRTNPENDENIQISAITASEEASHAVHSGASLVATASIHDTVEEDVRNNPTSFQMGTPTVPEAGFSEQPITPQDPAPGVFSYYTQVKIEGISENDNKKLGNSASFEEREQVDDDDDLATQPSTQEARDGDDDNQESEASTKVSEESDNDDRCMVNVTDKVDEEQKEKSVRDEQYDEYSPPAQEAGCDQVAMRTIDHSQPCQPLLYNPNSPNADQDGASLARLEDPSWQQRENEGMPSVGKRSLRQDSPMVAKRIKTETPSEYLPASILRDSDESRCEVRARRYPGDDEDEFEFQVNVTEEHDCRKRQSSDDDAVDPLDEINSMVEIAVQKKLVHDPKTKMIAMILDVAVEKTKYCNVLELRGPTRRPGSIILAIQKVSPNIFANLDPSDEQKGGKRYVLGVVISREERKKTSQLPWELKVKRVVNQRGRMVVAFCRVGEMRDQTHDTARAIRKACRMRDDEQNYIDFEELWQKAQVKLQLTPS